MSVSEKFEQDGVVLLKGILPDEALSPVRAQYDQLDKSLTRTEIDRDKPLVVFWRHVVGEHKRIVHFEEFHELWYFICI